MKLFKLILLLLAIPLSGCATSSALQQARVEFAAGAPVQALSTLENADVSERDALLLLLDKGAVAFSAGQYELAKDALLAANDLIEEWDQIRIGEQSATLITSEWAKRYRGEYSEKLWIHSYLMMTFLMQNNVESAAVEARRALQRMEEHQSTLATDWFTRALIGLSFEAAGAHDSAQVEYRKLANDAHYDGRWNHVIQRHSKSIGRDPIEKTLTTRTNLQSTTTQLGNDEGELIVFLQTGQIDKKLADNLAVDIDLHIAFPFYGNYRVSQPTYTVTANNQYVPVDEIDTHLVDVSSRALSARGKTIAAKQIARIAAKKAVVDVASGEDDILGSVLQLILFATEQADTRSWETLPGWLGLLRIPLPEGKQDVSVTVRHRGRTHQLHLGEIDIRANRMHFATFNTNIPTQFPLSTPSNGLTGSNPGGAQPKPIPSPTVSSASTTYINLP